MSAYEKAAQRRPWMKFYVEADARVPPDSTTALDLFRAVPPQSQAILYFDGSLDYAALDRLSDSVATAWAARGVVPGDRVAIVLQNIPQFLIAAVAAWKLAAIVVSLNPMYRHAEAQQVFSRTASPRSLSATTINGTSSPPGGGRRIGADLLIGPLDVTSRADDARVVPPARTLRPGMIPPQILAIPAKLRPPRSWPRKTSRCCSTPRERRAHPKAQC